MSGRYHLFEAFGVEIEYMLVGDPALDVLPKVDDILRLADGHGWASEYIDGPVTWSNELVRHVIELKVSEPVATLTELDILFDGAVRRINQLAEGIGGRLLPTAVHPWMDPSTETRLWPHEYADIYRRYHEIFNCYRHGWANLQSVHVNLPFRGDEEFARLHAAIRLVLPLIPAIAAASPVMEGRVTGIADSRLDTYINNSKLIDHITGPVIPEAVFSEAEYREVIFNPMMEGIRPFDPDGILEEEFLNSRGAIARFERGTVEIRLIDTQECPAADLGVVNAVVHAVRSMVEECYAGLKDQQAMDTMRLRAVLDEIVAGGERAIVRDPDYLQLWGKDTPCTAGDLWKQILRAVPPVSAAADRALDRILAHGTLSSRIRERLGEGPDRTALRRVFTELADCLAAPRGF